MVCFLKTIFGADILVQCEQKRIDYEDVFQFGGTLWLTLCKPSFARMVFTSYVEKLGVLFEDLLWRRHFLLRCSTKVACFLKNVLTRMIFSLVDARSGVLFEKRIDKKDVVEFSGREERGAFCQNVSTRKEVF